LLSPRDTTRSLRMSAQKSSLSSFRNLIFKGFRLQGPLWFIGAFILALIVLNIVLSILETVPELQSEYQPIFFALESISVVIFTIEYFLRLWSCVSNPDYQHPIKGRFRWMISPMGLIDLMVFLPFYISAAFPYDLRLLRAIRIVRVFMILKVGNYASSLNHIAGVVKRKKDELIVTASLGCILLLLSGSAIYYLENAAQPKVFSSIPASLWWSVVTLSTVGYGDIYPITTGGKIFASFIAILGIALFALPAGIIASGFAEELKAKKAHTCPHCNKPI